MRKEHFSEIIFENFGIHRENAVPFGTRSCRKFKPAVWIEWNGAHAKGTKFVTIWALVARARTVRAPLKTFLKSNFPSVWSRKS